MKKVLVVDDNGDERKILRITLERQGFEVIEARDGREGLETAVLQKPDMIVSDALMPKMDGFQFLRKVKMDERLQSVPFIFYSAVYTGHKEAELAISLGAEAFIVRPKEPDEFLKELRGVLEEHGRTIKAKVPATESVEEDEEFLGKYSQIVATKLEETVTELRKALAEHKREEEEIRHAYALTKTIIDSVNDAISLIDVRSFRIVGVNKLFLREYGYEDESEVIGKTCYEITHRRSCMCLPPDDICPLTETVKTGAHFAAEHVHYGKQGERIYVEVSTSPVKDENGNVIEVVHVARDITERKLAEEQLRESEEQHRTFFDFSTVGLGQTDPATGRLLRVNNRFCEITGYSREELLSTTVVNLTHPDDRAADSEKFMRMIRGEASEYSNEKRYIRKDGKVAWVHAAARVIRDAAGKPVRTVGVFIDITERKRLEEEITHMAYHDSLTGLPNRRFFVDIIRIECAQARRHRTKIALLFLDLDRFKEVNDTLGHEVGDNLLKEVASRLRTNIRQSDSISRIGGDEFNIVIADIAKAEDISDIARKIIESFRKSFSIAGHELHITTSIGISIYPDDSEDIDTIFRYADIAMYYAKERGRNAFQFYNPTINTRSLERMRLEGMLRQAIDRGELVVYYQPQINIRSGEMMCAEALVRWKHPEKGILEPKHFIPAAEDTGFITAIDEYVLRAACAQARSWLDAGLPAVRVTVNLSGREFQDAELVNKIARILKETDAPPDCLEVEITESLAMSNVERTQSRLDELLKIGVHTSIDNFGTGYSSLHYLKKLPIEKLKIDQSFIKDIAADPDDRAIISAVTAMAHTMRMKVLAEGVESAEQLSFLREIGCEEMQGYLFSKPLPAEEFREMISAVKLAVSR